MATDSLFAAAEKAPAVQSLLQRVEKGGVLSCPALNIGAHPFLAALLRHFFKTRPVVLVAAGVKTQEGFQQDVETCVQLANGRSRGEPGLKQEPITGDAFATCNPLFYPAWEILPHGATLPHLDVISERLETLIALSDKGTKGVSGGSSAGDPTLAPIIITSVAALLQRTFSAETLRQRTRRLTRGERVAPLELVEWLEAQGYEPEAQAVTKGEMALRGGILDVFPPSSPWPVRLEFFGDELDSLRYFDPFTQMSTDKLESITLSPAGELAILQKSSDIASSRPKRRSVNASPPLLATLIDYLPSETIFLLSEPDALDQAAEIYAQQVPAGDPFFIGWKDLREQIASRGMTVMELEEIVETETGLQFKGLDAFRPLGARMPDPQVAEAQRRAFFEQLQRWLGQSYAVHVFCNNEGERQRFEEIWEEYGLGGKEASSGTGARRDADAAMPVLHLGALTRGFLCEAAKLVVVTDAEIFGRYKVQRPRRLKSPHAQTSRSLLDINFTDLEEGDYVVHLQHGIGRFLGLVALPVAAGEKPLEKSNAGNQAAQECLAIEYAAGDPEQPPPKLYVPVSEAHLVSKYVGAGKARPPLNTLGGARWAKTKEQAERAVRDLAAEMLEIQAARASQAGLAFPPDAPWQREFESTFLYEETPDQMRAIVQSKADMEAAKPMDRLICGDVGYGKTEVAIRAAFKAVMGGKQVAVLVPTTILAQQHFNTFRERMADYPVRIELLSRFRTAREQKQVLQQLAAGAVDIVIGTHRLVQDDIIFKDLGLVVIDEEQRFGVLHKEKFKRLRHLVDVLTLSATPIPRTLYLALTGARDMSTIETPPQDRLPVETIVAQYDERVIRDAIQRELNRGGQVFYLHNRVFDIEAVAQRLRGLLPKARIAVGHGQMDSDDLEEVMTHFVNGEADVLLSTTIIESGLDIPNANTIIIDRADRFGLSDLYQLRGRVGRYKHQAYAYLLLPRDSGLLTDARKRINAIKQYSTLGSGFKIAMRDLEIRGAGNLLGSQQSGHITAVGFDLYCQLLQQSISSLKGEKVKPRVEVQVRLDFLSLNPGEDVRVQESGFRASRLEAGLEGGVQPAESAPRARPSPGRIAHAAIPRNYISDSRLRVEVYRKFAEITDAGRAEALRGELRDRFGALPPPVELLMQVAGLKVLASERGITSIETQDDKLVLIRNEDYVMVGGKFPRLAKKEPRLRLNEIMNFIRKL